MQYKPSAAANTKGGGDYPAGEYPFRVQTAEEVRFGTGTDGAKLELQVRVSDDREVKVFANLSYVDTAQWKLKQFMESIGLDFNNPPDDIAELEGRTGRAKFKPNKKGYLEAEKYLPSADGGAPAPAADYSGVGPGDWDGDKKQAPETKTSTDDVPF